MIFMENYLSFVSKLNELERMDITPAEGGSEKWEREIEMDPADIKFEVLAYDDGNYALVKEKSTGDLYILDSFNNDPEEFYQYLNLPYEMDEDGDWGPQHSNYSFSELLDKQAIETFATDIFNSKDPERLGAGLNDYEEGKSLIKIDQKLILKLIDSISEFIEAKSLTNSQFIKKLTQRETQDLKNMISILIKNYTKK